MMFLKVYSPGMAKIDHASQPELPIVQRITCRRCKGSGTVYYARMPAEVVGGKRIICPECNGVGKLDLADQLFRYGTASHDKKRRAKRRKALDHQLELT
jgi:DnaJ-class molecular chaperone